MSAELLQRIFSLQDLSIGEICELTSSNTIQGSRIGIIPADSELRTIYNNRDRNKIDHAINIRESFPESPFLDEYDELNIAVTYFDRFYSSLTREQLLKLNKDLISSTRRPDNSEYSHDTKNKVYEYLYDTRSLLLNIITSSECLSTHPSNATGAGSRPANGSSQ